VFNGNIVNDEKYGRRVEVKKCPFRGISFYGKKSCIILLKSEYG
jgi:hypothetical protein